MLHWRVETGVSANCEFSSELKYSQQCERDQSSFQVQLQSAELSVANSASPRQLRAIV